MRKDVINQLISKRTFNIKNKEQDDLSCSLFLMLINIHLH